MTQEKAKMSKREKRALAWRQVKGIFKEKTMIQEGMPLKFQAWNKTKKKMFYPVPAIWGIDKTDLCWMCDLEKETILLQAIGATSSCDNQELHLEDLIELQYEDNVTIGLIVWRDFSVMVKVMGNKDPCYWEMKWVLETYRIKKLGSRYTEEGKEILKKAGLEEK